MSGVDKIIEKINSDSESLCSAVIADSEKKCAKIAAEAEEKGKAIFSEIEKKAVSEGESIISMAHSAAMQAERQTILKAKVEAVAETLAKLTENLASKNCMPGSCTASLNAADLARMPSDFPANLTQALGASGAQCTLSDKPSDIGSGVFLDYGHIGIDCSFEAIIEENSDLYKEKISRIIF